MARFCFGVQFCVWNMKRKGGERWVSEREGSLNVFLFSRRPQQNLRIPTLLPRWEDKFLGLSLVLSRCVSFLKKLTIELCSCDFWNLMSLSFLFLSVRVNPSLEATSFFLLFFCLQILHSFVCLSTLKKKENLESLQRAATPLQNNFKSVVVRWYSL